MSPGSPSHDDVDVDVVIVTHNSADVVGACLRALPDAFPHSRLHVAVVDNASQDGTVDLVATTHPDVNVVARPDNAGYAAGINEGIRRLGGTGPVTVLNPDVRLAPGAGDALVRALARPGIGIAVPHLVDEAGQTLPSLRRASSVGRALGEAVLGGRRAGRVAALGEVVLDPQRYAHPGQAEWATGAVVAIARQCLEQTGEWDESFVLYSEETEFMIRARELGWRLWFEPSAAAVHLEGGCATSPHLWRLLVWNRVDLYRRHHGRLAGLAFRGALLLNEALRAADPVHRAGLRSLLGSQRPVLPAPVEAPLSTSAR